MIRRTIENVLLRRADTFQVVGIIGPRQSGKTTLTKEVFPEKRYISFDDKTYRTVATSSPQDFLKAFLDGAIIDEVQRVKEIFTSIKYYVDLEPYSTGKFVLTGSSSFRLKKNASESLAGRISLLKLLPFTLNEIKKSGLITPDPYEVIYKGMYPPLWDINKKFLPSEWFESYIETYIEEDVGSQVGARNLSTFKKFIRLCASFSGCQVSASSLSLSLGVSLPTIQNWLSILESSFIIHFLEVDSDNIGKKLVKTPKLYFLDSGLLCYLLGIKSRDELILSPYRGQVVESFAISEMIKVRNNLGLNDDISYFRDKYGFEVDCVSRWNKKTVFEIKGNSVIREDDSVKLKKYLSLSKEISKGAVLYLGEEFFNIDEIDYVPFSLWDDYFLGQC